MTTTLRRACVCLAALAACAGAAGHVTLPPGGATAGTVYDAAFRVGHACKDAKATTGITVRFPAGFVMETAQPHPGWALVADTGSVSWRADSPQSALPTAERAEFVVRGKLTERAGPLWFKVLQTCDSGSADWAEVPATADAKPAFPAARLDVLPAGVAPVDVRDGWVRMAVKGQSGTGAFMTLSAPAGSRLVGASTPVAAVAEVHEMSMAGGVMRMRAVEGGLDLPPRQAVELKPSGFHLMLMDLKRPLAVGEKAPLTLEFVDRQGRKSATTVELAVQAAPPAQAASGGHMH